MNSFMKRIILFLKDSWCEDKRRIKYFYYKIIQLYENIEFFRLRSKLLYKQIHNFKNLLIKFFK